ncbi:MAG: RiPP maturation radical SAM C-methyltransferase [Deltaproteobacteria bacterium]|nr:RiPP maturation radical SAM C-methyltransferase [Deltaproteobacteria bacterium]
MAPFRLALISMPWPLANRPSIQLAALKSFLLRERPDIEVHCYHLYVEVANLLQVQNYNIIAERTWAAESVYGYLLNPDKQNDNVKLFRKELKRAKGAVSLELPEIASKIELLHRDKHLPLPWHSYDLIGFSICLCQLTSSLYMIRALRLLLPECRIVAGGSACAGELGRSLLAQLPEIDFVISGEGELPLLQLVSHLQNGDMENLDSCPGLWWRDSNGSIRGGGIQQLDDLAQLPPGDFEDYFKQLHALADLANLIPSLPVETSRGCWWHRFTPAAGGRGCRFCNLNLQWQGYRSKKPYQVVHEIEQLSRGHAILKFFFVDNILDPDLLDEIFEQLYSLGSSLELFVELRASVSLPQLIRMRRAGVTEAQIGIESLSTRLLRKFNKGTTAIQNIEIMKHCETLGIRHHSNLLCGFPGSDEEDVAETLENLQYVQYYQPLRLVRFWLGQNSPVALSPARYGIRRLSNHPNYRLLLPGSLGDTLCLMLKTYHGDRTRQKGLWRPVNRQLKKWQQHYSSCRNAHNHMPILSYRDGSDFLLIRRRHADKETETFRMRQTSAAIYRYCETVQPMAAIRESFPHFSLDHIQTFIKDMVRRRLMFQEKDRVLSLAVNEEPHRLLCGHRAPLSQ